MKILITIIVFVFTFGYSFGQWFQLGESIKDLERGSAFAYKLAVSGDGLTVIAGSDNYHGFARYIGRVEVFRYIDGEWTKIGDIKGTKEDDQLGWTVDINYDGNIIAVGARESQNGFVRLYKYENDEWLQMGEDLVAENHADFFGFNIALDDSGYTVIISAIHNDDFGHNAGTIKTYGFVDESWEQKGKGINGRIIDINANGNVIALDDDNSIEIYEFVDMDWKLIGDKITINGYTSIDLDNKGYTVAIGMISDKVFGKDGGRTKVYKFDGTEWVQLGETFYNHSGRISKINGEGNIIATGGSAFIDEKGQSFFNPKIYGLFNGRWESMNLNIDGEENNNFIGSVISLSDDGFTIAIGGQSKISRFGYTDDFRVYTHSTRTFVKNQDNKQIIKLFPNPANERVNIKINENDQLIECTIIDLNGRTVYSKTSYVPDFSIDLNKLPSGVYYVTVKDNNGISKEKLIIQ